MNSRTTIVITALTVVLPLLFVMNLVFGAVNIPFGDVARIIAGSPEVSETWRYIVIESRLPQAITALLAGAALATSGLLLQTLFNNPLAGPSILGISSGASLGVALVMLFFGGSISIVSLTASGALAVVAGAMAGAMAVMLIILYLSTMIRSNTLLLITGIMVGYLTSSVITLLNFFATAEGVQSYIVWGMGDFSGVALGSMHIFGSITILGLLLSALLIKPLNALLLGTDYAENLGIIVRRTRMLLLASTGIMTGIVTAYCGPIAFIGIATPHIARLMLNSGNQKKLVPATMLSGAIIAMGCNILCTVSSETLIPINAVTPIIGAPVIIFVILNNKRK
ncbi:MAG: iron ABC transporter permease [Bacteroidaceae bacterium]|nr:iron ABC transporter permease [Bacteroidaceae bacterium]